MGDYTKSRTRAIMRVSLVTVVINAVLSAFKLVAGIVGRSGAMLSDAVHSLSDVFSTIIVMLGVRMAGKASDEDHPYGHERLESVAAMLLAIMLAATGIGIGYAGVMTIIRQDYAAVTPGVLALVAAIVSIAVKEGMYWYTAAVAKKVNSGALMADAWHHRTDAMSSVGSLIGIAGARMGAPILDPIASVVICLFIVRAAVIIFRDAARKMTDTAGDKETTEKISRLACDQHGVLGVDKIRTRLFGDRLYVDIEICADGESTLAEGHDIAESVHDAIEREFPTVKHCMVHVNPAGEEEGE